MSNKVLIIGANGMLGHKLVQVLRKDHDVWACIRMPLSDTPAKIVLETEKTLTVPDIICGDEFSKAVAGLRPDVIINAAGIIKQVPEAADNALMIEVNAAFPHRLSAIAREAGARVITIGTDCVFSGKKGNYSENDIPDAVDLYGRSKLLGELSDEHCLTLRTSIIGRELGSRHSLVEWFLSNRGKTVKGYTNAVYSGMPTIVLAETIRQLLNADNWFSGIYHVASRPITKYQLLERLNAAYDAGITIEPDNNTQIDRSLNGNLFYELTGIQIPDWDSMIDVMVNDADLYSQ
jgi:dTDP-4-dehydrorhamnose reductase